MKKLLTIVTAAMLFSTAAISAEFAPTLLKLSSEPVIQYDFDGTDLNIPVTVSGTNAGVILCVFTRNQSDDIDETINGYLGWHHVNKIDTCVYYSSMKNMGIGTGNITWNGKDQDGGTAAAGEYTYYLWGYDNQGVKQLMSQYAYARSYFWEFQEVDVDGIPMANPLFYQVRSGVASKLTLGSDPVDSTLIQTSDIGVAEGWSIRYTPALDPGDFDYFYMKLLNGDAGTAAITKWKFVPGGEAEFQSDFGLDGYSEGISTPAGGSDSGVCTDGTYIFTSDRDSYSTETPVDFYIYDMEGYMVSEIDLQQWWSSLDDLEAGAQANGGPNGMMMRNGMIFLNCHCSCLKQMVDPYRFLDTEDSSDFFVWTNGNGDYVLDHNFEDTASAPWACMDYNVGPYTYNLDADNCLFSQSPAYDVGAVSFGLMAPDGTGLGYFSFAGETAGWKKSSVFLDSDTPFDGLYCDNEQTGGSHYDYNTELREDGIFFVGHDVIEGIITSAVNVDANAPAAFTVNQNVPNPFNPSTTISFALAQAGDISIAVYNVAGQKVDTLADGFMQAGSHSVVWDASGFSAGVYFYTVKAGNASRTMKMTLVK